MRLDLWIIQSQKHHPNSKIQYNIYPFITPYFYYCILYSAMLQHEHYLGRGGGGSQFTSWKFNLHVACILRMAWNFQILFYHVDRSIKRKLTPLWVTYSHVQITTPRYLWGYSFIKIVGQIFHQLDNMTFSESSFCLANWCPFTKLITST